MNKNRITGAWQNAKGKVKEELGHALGNRQMEAEGVGGQIKGNVSKNIGKAKDAIKKVVDSALDAGR